LAGFSAEEALSRLAAAGVPGESGTRTCLSPLSSVPGNKRTALVATLVFLDLNGFVLEVEENELFDYLLRIADHKVVLLPSTEDLGDQEMREVARWLHRNSRPISSAEQTLKFHELRSILNRYGCTFDEDGYDSTVFYNAAERVPDFIMKYRRTLDRLAKV
jgi:death-on-curing protein